MRDYLIKTLRMELKPALGCTEPIAIALATASAGDYFNGEIAKIELELSGNILKNAMGVGIPGTGMIGIDLAAILGAIAGKAQKGLEVLEDINQSDIDRSVKIKEKDIVTIEVSKRPEKLYIRGRIYNSEGKWVEAEIVDVHDQVTRIESDTGILFERELNKDDSVMNSDEDHIISVRAIYDFALSVDLEAVDFVLEGVKLNSALSEVGLQRDWGLKVGKSIQRSIEKGYMSDDYKNYSMMKTAAAVDARMDGSKLAAMSNSGSGDQGITAIVSVYSAWEKMNLSEEKLIRALVISNLMPIHIKRKLGRLSALCGATVAGVGAAAGIVYLLDGDFNQIVKAMNNQIGGITGLFCDGAKTSCSFKAANSIDAAFNSAFAALEGNGIRGYEGIIDDDIEKSINNMARLGNEGMRETDKMILDIMIEKTI